MTIEQANARDGEYAAQDWPRLRKTASKLILINRQLLRPRITRELWPSLTAAYDTYVSALVYEEVARGDLDQASKRLEAIKPFLMLDIDDEARELAEKIVSGNGIPKEYPEDALHIAVAALNGIAVIVTWNFAHLSNPFTRMMVRQIVENEGYVCPEICSPEELLESEL